MAAPLVSPDGRWWWDGTRWVSRVVDGELDLFWFTSTPEWMTRVLITGLIGLIPIVGTINTYGWTLTAVDMIRGRWRELPPAGFQYLERGVAPFVVALLYGLAAVAVLGTLIATAVLVGVLGGSKSAVALALVVGTFTVLLALAWWLLVLFLFAALLLTPDRLGIVRGLDPSRLWAVARANNRASVRVAVIYGAGALVLGLVGGALGFVIPFAGVLASLGLPAAFAAAAPALATVEVAGASSSAAATPS